MNAIGRPASGRRRAAALAVLAIIVVLPVAWVLWSLHAAAVTTEMNESQAGMLVGFHERLKQLGVDPESAGALADAASVFLPGETAAIAGAALQRIVADSIEGAGGRVVESELPPVEATAEDPGRVDLRVSFDADIVSLQRILFQLETGAPVLFVRGLTVQSDGAQQVAETESPRLRVVMTVGGNWEVPE